MTLEQLSSVVTILAFIVYLFIEAPRLQERWKESRQISIRILVLVSNALSVSALPLMIIAFFFQGFLFGSLVSSSFLLMGTAGLLSSWIDNRLRAEKRMAHGTLPLLLAVVLFALSAFVFVSLLIGQ